LRGVQDWPTAPLIGLAAAALAIGFDVRTVGAAPLVSASSTCVADDPVPTPKDYLGWERSGRVAWEAIEQYGGIVPEIEEDRSHAPPAWWRYPSPLRSAEILAAEAKAPKGLYRTVSPGEIKQGDILVRASGAGACGKMAILGGQVGGQWMTLEAGDDDGSAMRTGNPMFFVDAGKSLRNDVAVFRIQVKKDETLGHVRELRRDLEHLERTIAERPVLVVKSGRMVVDEKVHDLIDEAWSLVADNRFDLDRRELTGRALALGAALDWPGAEEVAAAVLDDVLRRSSTRPEALIARAAVYLLSGDADKAVAAAEAATLVPGVLPRAHYLLGRSLIAAGKTAAGLTAIKTYVDAEPLDPRARRLLQSKGVEPKLEPIAAPEASGLRLGGSFEKGEAASDAFGFRVGWPITWRVVGVSAADGTGVMLNLATGRVILDDGDTERGAATLLVQHPESAAERSALVKKAGRNLFPGAKLRTLPALLPGSKREQFRETQEGAVHQGEVTTLERGGTIYFLVLNASLEAYGKLKGEYAGVVKSLALSATK
jgi:tetratricopeptide (TPR) repeat protein